MVLNVDNVALLIKRLEALGIYRGIHYTLEETQ